MKKSNEIFFEEFVADSLAGEGLDYVEQPISKGIFWVLAAVALSFSAIILIRVGYLNVVKASFYDSRSEANVNREVAIPAHRGLIVDRNGRVLAKNTETFSVFVNANELLKDRGKLQEVIEKIAEATGEPVEGLNAVLSGASLENSNSVPIVRGVSPETAISVRGLDLDSVQVENDFRREYLSAEPFASVVGYTGFSNTDNQIVGKTGLESHYDSVLRGTDGVYVYHRDARGEVIDEKIEHEPVSGSKLVSTLDGDFQEYLYRRLESGVRSLGTRAGAVGIALEPHTGEVLALVSYPSYNSNIFVTPGNSKERAKIINDSAKPLFNRAVSGSYNPGSTIKPLVALGALREQIVAPDFQIFSKGYIEIPNPYVPEQPSRFVDWKAHGWVDVRSALARSSNVYFYEIGGGFENLKGLGVERLKKYWQQFGFGLPTGIDLDSEAQGFLPDPDEKEERTGQPWRIGDTYNVSIGQGDLLVSPIQLVNFISSIANGGKLMKPRLVKEIISPAGESEKIESEVIYDYSNWTEELTEIQEGMLDAVRKDYGTAKLLGGLPFTSAGKTGTAQIQNNTKNNAFFVGYAPAVDSRIAVVILIENAKEGSLNAVPIAYDVLNWYYMNRLNSSE